LSTNTWERVALPLIELVHEAEQTGGEPNLEAFCADTGAAKAVVNAELQRLLDAALITGKPIYGAGSTLPIRFPKAHVTSKGAEKLGLWPSSDPYDALVQLLQAAIADPDTSSEARSKYQQFLDAATDVGKGTVVGILTALIRGQAGI
jgi:hypothetical protein